MNQNIASFRQDEKDHWVAVLTCGHSQHLRHNPPWMNRPWVLSDEGRKSHLGSEIDCVLCEGLDGASEVSPSTDLEKI